MSWVGTDYSQAFPDYDLEEVKTSFATGVDLLKAGNDYLQ
jgi:hypothetical protein